MSARIGAPGTCADEIKRRCGVAHTLRAVEMRASRIHCSLAVRTVCPSCGAVGVDINKATGHLPEVLGAVPS
ncbi:MAG: hypothetical protein ACOX12_01530 [Eggerthellaceae bacterium]